ncbi:MAG TPA: hypothetical protein VM243_09185 [Phycisphaerae bacterium]|nr:hypothetical protein [Phycisphaerae bacterium]
MADRIDLAERIAFGLGGWFQTLACQSIAGQAGENAAKLTAVQLLNAQNAYVPESSARPLNWGNTRLRIDIAIKGPTPAAKGWYGAIEIKWPGAKVDLDQTRAAIVQDALRLSFVETANIRANLLVVGGESKVFQALFDKPHPRAPASEQKRQTLGKLLSRNSRNTDGMLLIRALSSAFSNYADRIPANVLGTFDGRLKTILLASCDVKRGHTQVGQVFVWHCRRARGTQGVSKAIAAN